MEQPPQQRAALWDSPRQREAYDWFIVELANLPTAFRWAADHGDLDVAATIATYAPLLGVMVESHEPIAWAEELIERARAVDHPRLAVLYVMASQCWISGRVEAAVGYSDAAQRVIDSGRAEVPSGIDGYLGTPYLAIGQPERWLEWCRAAVERRRDLNMTKPTALDVIDVTGGYLTKTILVIALTVAGLPDEAMAAADGVMETAETTRNPWALSLALSAYGFAFRDADPVRAREALRRGLTVAQDSGNVAIESQLASALSALAAQHGDPLAAFDYFTVAIRNYHDSGNTTMIRGVLALLAALFDRLGRYESAATIAGFGVNPLVTATNPEINTAITHLRDVLGGQTYESLAHKGEAMTMAAMATYAYDQIDQARAELNASQNRRHMRVSKLRLGDSTAIWPTSLTSGDTILTWTPAGMVAVD